MKNPETGLVNLFRFAHYLKLEIFIPRQPRSEADLTRLHGHVVNLQLESAPDRALDREKLFGPMDLS